MNEQKLRLIIREQVESLIEEHPEIFEEIRNQRLDEGLMDWLRSAGKKIADVFSKIGGEEGIAKEIESDQQGWLTKIKKAVAPTPVFKEMLAKVQEIVDEISSDSAPPATGLQLATEEKSKTGTALLEDAFQQRIAEKSQKPNFLSSIATVMMIISLFSDKVILVADMWWIVICVGLIGINALSKIMLAMARKKMDFKTAKVQMAQQAGLQPAQLQSYINSRTSAKFSAVRGR
jgi:hypothetical protein